MTRNKKAKNPQVEDIRYEDAKRKNIPPAGLATHDLTPVVVKQIYHHNPNLFLN